MRSKSPRRVLRVDAEQRITIPFDLLEWLDPAKDESGRRRIAYTSVEMVSLGMIGLAVSATTVIVVLAVLWLLFVTGWIWHLTGWPHPPKRLQFINVHRGNRFLAYAFFVLQGLAGAAIVLLI